jgi:hypothetical protein
LCRIASVTGVLTRTCLAGEPAGLASVLAEAGPTGVLAHTSPAGNKTKTGLASCGAGDGARGLAAAGLACILQGTGMLIAGITRLAHACILARRVRAGEAGACMLAALRIARLASVLGNARFAGAMALAGCPACVLAPAGRAGRTTGVLAVAGLTCVTRDLASAGIVTRLVQAGVAGIGTGVLAGCPLGAARSPFTGECAMAGVMIGAGGFAARHASVLAGRPASSGTGIVTCVLACAGCFASVLTRAGVLESASVLRTASVQGAAGRAARTGRLLAPGKTGLTCLTSGNAGRLVTYGIGRVSAVALRVHFE